ncbi:hypothetical protein [Sphingomonas lenta]|uniref:Uncharacterized protein n=1 Tax=Sphingomonas lenta TaxID=1141887 RepID=A0A2A2SB23_9SPHN|nr:hypothetical protein [Sphingomonas lenta]PAX06382.1 hypothetical protein CKY28_17420 [Sphingomonas lenta]
MSGRAAVSIGALLSRYDFELPIKDALDDPEMDPTRRALAVLAIGTGLDDGHLAAAELGQAARRLADDRAAGAPDGVGEGARAVRRILAHGGDDYQRALWYAVSRCSPDVAARHLEWLAELTRARGGMFRAIQASGAYMPLLPRGMHDIDSAQLGPD